MSSNTVASLAGRALPAAGRWTIDPAHSRVGFSVRHATVTTVHGRFTDVAGVIAVADELQLSSVVVTIRAASFSTALRARDADITGRDWLDAERFPTLEFASTAVDLDGPRGTVTGDLTVHGVTRPTVLQMEYAGIAVTPQGEQRAGFSATTRIDRRDFGVGRNVPLASGGFFVSYGVGIAIDVSAVSEPALAR